MAGCIFCGKSPVTAEHIVSKWIAPVLADDPRESLDPDKHIFFSRRGGIESQREWNQAGVEFTAKCVCRDCNNGWMENIERRARPFIEPMIRGQEVTIPAEGQEAIAQWLTLKAIVDRYAQSPTYPVANNILQHFYTHHTPPRHWFIVLAAYDGSWPVRVATDVYDSLRLMGTRVPFYKTTNRRSLFTISIAYFVGQVFGPEKSLDLAMSSHESAFVIWPPPSSIAIDPPIHWPPPNILGDEALDVIDTMVDGLPR